jgi:molecular chaperone GrpE
MSAKKFNIDDDDRRDPPKDESARPAPKREREHAASDAPASDADARAKPRPEPADEAAALRARVKELEDALLRSHADYQNLARRAQINVREAREQALMEIAKAMLTVMDHFDHALLVDAQKTSAEDLMKGVHIVRDQLLQTLERFGVKRLNVEVGDEFDPNRHEALMRQPADDLDSNRVAAELQAGYTIGERTLRPAKVSVSE